MVQDLRCSDDSSSEDSSSGGVTSSIGGDVTADHVTPDDVRDDFRSTVDNQSQTVMTSLASSRHVTTLNSSLSSPVSRLPSSSSSSMLRAASASQDDLAATLRQGHEARTRTQRSDAGGRVDGRSVQDLEAMLNQVEASERQAWDWLEALDSENSQRQGDLRHYTTMTSPRHYVIVDDVVDRPASLHRVSGAEQTADVGGNCSAAADRMRSASTAQPATTLCYWR